MRGRRGRSACAEGSYCVRGRENTNNPCRVRLCVSQGELILAIETSNPSSGPRGRDAEGRVIGPGVALGSVNEKHDIIADEPLAETSRHDDDLMPAIARLFDRAGATPRDLAIVAVSVGPGGYTGVRIAVAAAKLIAEASGAKAVAVPSAVSAGWNVRSDRTAIICLASKNNMTHATALPHADWWALHADAIKQIARPDDFAHAAAQIDAGRLWISAACPLGVIGAEQFEALAPDRLVADCFVPDPIRSWAQASGVEIVEPVFSPALVCRIARGGRPTDPALLRPIYPREPDAVRQWRLRTSGNKPRVRE
jgi:tRNA threonylcarbamoyl adenosine modification protein YeaZ